MQRWPVEKKAPLAAHSTAVGRSASSSTTSGFLPPISSWNLRMVPTLAAATFRRCATEPVKVMALMSGLSSIACPTTEPRPMTRLNTPFGQAGTVEDVDNRPGAAGHEIGRLEDDRVAVAQRRRDLPGGNGDREVPRRDDADDADGLAGHLDADARANQGTVSPVRRRASPAKKSKIWAARDRLADALGQRLAFLAAQQLAEFVLAGEDLVRRLAQDGVALQKTRAGPGRGMPPWPQRWPGVASSASARAYTPTTSLVLEGLMFGNPVSANPFAVDQILVHFSHDTVYPCYLQIRFRTARSRIRWPPP